MKVSIITSSFNSAKTIRDTLESIASQDYPDIEHIIIDGGSTDTTLEILKEYAHVSKVISERDKGIYDAMNKGIKLATGDIIGILNSDDFYVNKSVIRNIVETFKTSKAQSLYADLDYVDAIEKTKVIRKWRTGEFHPRKFYYGWMPPHPTFFVRKEIYDKHGLFDLKFNTSADYELMLRFLVKHKISAVYYPEVIVHMRTGGQSSASLQNRLHANREDALAWKNNGLNPYFFTIILKPLRKILQFIR